MTDRGNGPVSPAGGGHIITFYSYKGGTGRSMLMANVAWILASTGKRVLVVDWDLEAPGLHRYYQPFLVDPELTATDGVIDMVIDYVTDSVSNGDDARPDWYHRHADVLRYAVSLDHDFGQGTLDLLSAGRQGPSYSTRVNTFDWRNFYEVQGGGAFLEAVRDRMRAAYDYVLIDSRTGVSDTSGICTVQFPDTLVVCFTMNNQSVEGAAGIAASVYEQRRASGLRIFPVPTRVESAEKDKLEQRRALVRTRFALFPNIPDAPARAGGTDTDDYWGSVEMPYVPYYAYEEILTTIGDRPGQTNSLLAATERITSWITDGRVRRLPTLPEARRLELLALYAPRRPDVPEAELGREAERIYNRLSGEQQTAARRLFMRMVRVARPGEGRDQLVGAPFADVSADVHIANAFLAGGIIRIDVSDDTGDRVVHFANPALFENWPRLRQWVDDDRDFLAFRDLLVSNRSEWQRSTKDAATLLAGPTLEAAEEWAQARGGELTDADREFIAASSRNRSSRRRLTGVRFGIGGFLLLSLALSTWQSRREDRRRDDAEAFASTAASFAAVGQYDSAVAYYGQAIATHPGPAQAWHGRGHGRLELGWPDSALADLDSALVRDSTSAEVWADRGQAFAQLDSPRQALQSYTRALQLNAVTADVFFNRGAAFQALGQPDSAVASFQAVLTSSPDDQTRDAATARLRQLGADSALLALPSVRVLLSTAPGEDAALVERLAALLRTNGFAVESMETPSAASAAYARVFSRDDIAAANVVIDIVQKTLAEHGYRVRVQRIDPDGRTPAARGRIAVGLPRLASPPAASR